MSSEEVAVLSKEEAIKETIRQVEFYFADANLPFDKFLWTLTRKDNGWVPISTLASFKRMKPMRNALNDQELADAIKSSASDLLEVDEKGEKVRRKKELVKQTGAFDRSIYAKGFPINETPQLQPDLEKYFAEFGKINSVRFRRADPSKVSSEYPPKGEEAAGATSTEASTSTSTSEPAKKEESTSKNNKPSKWPFKGSVFVEFSSKEEQEAFLEKAKSEPENLKYEGKTLEIMSKKDYCDMKIKEKGINPEDAYKREGGEFDGKKTSGRTNLSGKTSGFNAFKEMEKEEKFGSSSNNKNSEEEKKKRQEELEKKLNEDLEFDFNGVKLISNSKGEIDSETIPIPKNTVLSFKNVGDGKEGDWKTLKDDLNQVQKPKFVEFPEGSKEGKVAFHDEINDETLEKIKGLEIKLGGNVVEWEKVNDEDSTTFYKERAHFRAKFMLQKREEELKSGGGGSGSSSSRGGGRGRGGRGGNSGGRGGRGRGNRGGSRGGGAGRDTRSGNKRDREESNQGSGGNKKAKTEA